MARLPGGDNFRFKVIGVVKDFNIESLQAAITPFVLFHTSSRTYDMGLSNIVAKIKSGICPVYWIRYRVNGKALLSLNPLIINSWIPSSMRNIVRNKG
jgi:hypothetical protein